MIALIDGDEVAWIVATSYEQKVYGVYREDKFLWNCKYKQEAIESIGNEQDLEIIPGVILYDSTHFKKRLNEVINNILDRSGCHQCRIFLSGANNFRKNFATLLPYKGNRTGERPAIYPQVRQELLEQGAEYVDFLEADDMLSAYSSLIKEKTIICSSDKDLKTVPTTIFDIKKRNIQTITKSEALYNFYYQLLIGDATDNIPSPYLLGPVGAKNILKDSYGSELEEEYLSNIILPYTKFLMKQNEQGEYLTKWYDGSKTINEILYEIGNLLYMHRTLDPDERWELPKISLFAECELMEFLLNNEKKECLKNKVQTL